MAANVFSLLVTPSALRYNAAQPYGTPGVMPSAYRYMTLKARASTRPTKEKLMVDRIRRSWLIVPAHDDARLEEAAQAGADVVVLDLQDMVHDTKKHVARARV